MTQETDRPLSASEAALWWLDRAARLNFTTVARVRGPLTRRALAAALDALRARHPLLRARIEPDAAGVPWFRAGGRPLGLRVFPARPADLERHVEAEIAEPFDWTRGPLARCRWVRYGKDDGHLLLTLQHCIGDGKSGVFAMRDLVRSAAAALEGADPALPALAPTPPLDAALPARVHGAGYLWTTAGYLGRLAWRRLTVGSGRILLDEDVPPWARQVRVRTAIFDADRTARLSARARAEGTTVHGILAAALLQAVAAEHEAGPVPLHFATPVDLRERLTPAPGEAAGFFIGLVDGSYRVDPNGDPWSLARAVRRDVARDVANGVCMFLPRYGRARLRQLTRDDPPPEHVAERLYAMRPAIGLTNLGRLPIDTRFGALRAESLYFAVGVSALGDHVTTATSFAGRLHWSYCWGEPTLSRARALRLWRAAVERVSRCC